MVELEWKEHRVWVQMAWVHALALPVVDLEPELESRSLEPRVFISSYSKLR